MRMYRTEPRFGSVLKMARCSIKRYVLRTVLHTEQEGDLRSVSLHEGFLRPVSIVAGQRKRLAPRPPVGY